MIKKPIKAGQVNFNHPYFWSSFVVIGNSLQALGDVLKVLFVNTMIKFPLVINFDD